MIAKSDSTLKNFFRGSQSMIKRFFEKCDAGEIGVSEVDVAVWLHGFFKHAAPDEVWAGRDHCVAPTHDVYSCCQFVDIGMGA